MTAGVTAYFTYSALTFGIAKARGISEIHGGAGALIAFGAYIVTMLAVLWVNDYLGARYPIPTRTEDPVSPVDQ
jgi:hypothetical protein